MASASCSAQTLVVGLYDYANLSAKQTGRLTETAGLAFAHSGIDVVWLHCRGALASAPGAGCEGELQVNEIVVRLGMEGSTPLTIRHVELSTPELGGWVTSASAQLCGPNADPYVVGFSTAPRGVALVHPPARGRAAGG